MLTDVGDNSIKGSLQFVSEASKNDDIHLTIVGISNDFRSETCEILKNVKGFNYFCAINNADIKKHIFEEFNFSFLSVAHNVEISLEADNVMSFETFGAPDSSEVKKYNDDFKCEAGKFVISRVSTVFPSQVEIKDGKTYTAGGVILVKLQKKKNSEEFKGRVRIQYVDLNQVRQEEVFEIGFNYPEKEQFYSEESLREALQGYGFTSEVKNLIRKVKESNKEDCEMYLKHLNYLETIAPKSKKSDLDSIRKILEKMESAKKPPKESAK